jgi:hypothetical protein
MIYYTDKKNLLLFIIFITFIVSHILLSIYFIAIFFLGFMLIYFIKNNSFFIRLSIMLFIIFIELHNGFYIFSIFFLFFFIFFYIVPSLKRIILFSEINCYIYITIFYIAIFILYTLVNDFNYYFFKTIVFNIIIDFILVLMLLL